MASATAEFSLSLEDGISASSESAEDSLKSLQSQIDKDAKSLAQMKKAMRQMQAGGSVDVSAYRKLKSEIDATENSIGKARASFINLGGDFSKIGKKAKKAKFAPDVEKQKGFKDLLSSANSLPGPLGKASSGIGNVHSKIAGLTGALGMTAAAILGVAAALTVLVGLLAAVAAATAKATAELLKYAVAQADAMRSERLRLQGAGTLRRWMRLTGKDAAQMSESINRVSETVPLARDQIAGYGQELHRLGIRGRAAESALEALSLAQAVQGDVGRQRLMMLVRQAGHSEGAMADLAARVRKELGSVAGGQMRALGMIAMKLRESFQALFTGIDIQPILDGLFRLSQLFSRNSNSGRALRSIMTALFGPLVDELGSAAEGVEYFFKKLVILALKAAIAFMRIKIQIRRTFGSGILGRLLRSRYALDIFKVGLIAVGIVIGTLAVGVAGLVLVVIGLIVPLLGVAAALYRAYQAVLELRAAFDTLKNFFTSGNWIVAGKNIIEGIVAGLDGEMLQNAVRSLATGALETFRNVLGIHSPSSVFARLGLAIPQGVVAGVNQGASEATNAAGNVVSTTTNTASSVLGGSSRAVTIGEIHVHAGGSEGGEDTARRVTDALRDFFETGLEMESV